MNSLERVKAALHFDGPDKVPAWKPGSSDIYPMIMIPSQHWQPGHVEEEKGLFPHAYYDATISAGLWKWHEPQWVRNNPHYTNLNYMKTEREEIDPWGCFWNRTADYTSMGHPGRPCLTDWADLDEYLEKNTPDPLDLSQYSQFFIDTANTNAKNKYHLCILGLVNAGPFQMAANIRNFTQFLIDHRRHPKEVKKLLRHLTDWYIDNMKGWERSGASPHGFYIPDDLGTDNAPFFSPKVFKEFYEPVYKRIIDASHELGCEFHLHCCGKIDLLLPLLVEWGLDAIELDAPRMTGYTDLREFRGKIMFWGCLDIGSVYINATPEECEREVWHMIRNLGTSKGGFGAFFYPEPHVIRAPKENVKAFINGLKKYGVYEKIPSHWWKHPVSDNWDNYNVPDLPPLETIQ
ncbi:MAG: Methylcobalamin:coenzyme M methyltransferase (modular protein) [Promethearchaeota archaeon]|nr:MAG: Methylcobalamin:coenzyme M methyltransferase (modular protein) [Candidatus Lokiarchaeota archaeon]